MADPTHIVVRNARTHNLRGVDVSVPRHALVVFSGVSGSGKSSLVFDTIHLEGQRRFMESLSSYARQFLGQMERPEVDAVEGISPTVSIDQKTVNRNPRSTVGTVTEIHDHLRLLFARLGEPRCPLCDHPISKLGPRQIVEDLLATSGERTILVLGPVVQERKGEYRKELEALAREGWVRARIDGEVVRIEEAPAFDRYRKHTIEVVVDRLVANVANAPRLLEAVERALTLGRGTLRVLDDDRVRAFSASRACPNHPEQSIPELEPRLFSFNAPQGACPSCEGLGDLQRFEPDRFLRRDAPGVDAFVPFNAEGKLAFSRLDRAAWSSALRGVGVDPRAPVSAWTSRQRIQLLEGDPQVRWTPGRHAFHAPKEGSAPWPGLIALLEQVWKFAKMPHLEALRSSTPCEECGGTRLNPIARAVVFRGRRLPEVAGWSVERARAFFHEVTLEGDEALIGSLLLAEIRERLGFLLDVGLGYLGLSRSAATLSGGEAQRIRLAGQVGSGLQGVTYVLDEPSIGLHPRDNQRLLDAIRRLRDRGNSVLVVEHDAETLLAADWIVDVGPGAGREGGYILASGPPAEVMGADTPTFAWLRGERTYPTPPHRAPPEAWLVVRDARLHNLDGVTLRLPVGRFTALTGVSGSGKSTLLFEVLQASLASMRAGGPAVACEGVDGADAFADVVEISQRPIGRTPRSNPATYTGAMDLVRDLFAGTEEARARGWTKARFSFNVSGGRCEVCEGAGVRTIEMQFLPDVEVPCEACEGRRFPPETLEVRYQGLSIADVLALPIAEAAERFQHVPKLRRILSTLLDVGLGYVTLGQPSTTLSGGEAQRVKLATELHRVQRGRTLYLLDEPTTGLHFEDVRKLLVALDRLVEAGHTVVVVEHHIDLVRFADHVVDLGPEGGVGGGRIVGEGTPSHVATLDTPTGRALAEAATGGGAMLVSAPSAPSTRTRPDALAVYGARLHNLASIDAHFPHGAMTVVTGPSGSGKTSLAFGTVFAEGQRRYVESLSTYARRFLGRLDRPPLDRLEGLQPAIAVDQGTASGNPRSTVATVTEIHDVLRVLYARVGVAHCPTCDAPVRAASAAEVASALADAGLGPGWWLAPLPARVDAAERREALVGQGWTRLLSTAGGRREEVLLDDEAAAVALLGRGGWLVVDRFDPARVDRARRLEAVERAYGMGDGTGFFLPREGSAVGFSRVAACLQHGPVETLTPRHFSFNSRVGMCARCEGLGVVDRDRGERVCPACGGERLGPLPRAVRVGGERIGTFARRTVDEALRLVDGWALHGADAQIAERPLAELRHRLRFLADVGLGYLTLDRRAGTLSGGENQRIRLASQLGSGLCGVTYVLDEPTVGLHPRDTGRLLDTLFGLRDAGNTLVVVEHDLETIARADRVIDMGPGAGTEGGHLVAAGTPEVLALDPASVTGPWLSGRVAIPSPARRREPSGRLVLTDATTHNLRVPRVAFALGLWTAVTGVSGAGKSTLVLDTLVPALAAQLGVDGPPPGRLGALTVEGAVGGLVVVDASPIGRNPRSTPATFIGFMDRLRALYADTPLARERGWGPGRFSFNAVGGRCEVCEGRGAILLEMHFLPDVWVPCSACRGRRYGAETLEVRFRGHTIADILGMRADEACEVFAAQRALSRALRAMCDVGLGYLTLGQPGHTLSGGEAQRLKLVAELLSVTASRRGVGKVLVLDEPTTGLHLSDVARLVDVLHRLVDAGHTVITVEHHLDVVRQADAVIELGPEGGAGGGTVIATGTPASLAALPTPTGVALRAEDARRRALAST
jgi:excinuclease ABC subunit A